MFNKLNDYKAQIKVYHRNDWVWLTIEIKKSDVDYIKRNYSDWSESNPTLELNGKVWSLRFLYKKDISLSKTKLKEQIVIGVDLNTITSAFTDCAKSTIARAVSTAISLFA